MASSTEKPRKTKPAAVLVWVLLAMLIVGLAGFSVTSFSGGRQVIGRVGDRDLMVQDYFAELRGQINMFSQQVGTPITGRQALEIGLDRRARQALVSSAALANEAHRIGLSIGNARVAQEVVAIPAFQGVNGQFDPEGYRFTLQQNGQTPAEFETRIRDDEATQVLIRAVEGYFAAPAAMVDTRFAYVAETRGLSVLQVTETDLLAPPPAPSDADLETYHTENPQLFQRPAARRVDYAVLRPAALLDGVDVPEADLRAAYDGRIAEFVQPEKRLVERLVFPDDAAAAAAKARLDAGESFDALVAERGLQLTDIDLGDVARADLGAAGEAVFALTEPGVTGPLPTDLGPALFRMNAILPAQETTFDQAREGLRADLAVALAEREVAARRGDIDDALAGGASLDDLASEDGMVRGTLDLGRAPDDPLAQDQAFAAAVAQATVGDDPALVDLGDGGLAAFVVTADLPAETIPFVEARAAVDSASRAARLDQALAARAEEIRAQLSETAPLSSFGTVTTIDRTDRDATPETLPRSLVTTAFGMAQGEARVISEPGWTGLVVVDAITPADAANPDQATVRATLAAQAGQALAQDALALFTNALVTEAGVQLDEAMINAVHAQLP